MPERYAFLWRRDVVEVVGPEAEPFLQGQLSQDISRAEDGGSTWSWVLAPAGKVDALVRVTRLAADEWVLDTDGGWGELLSTRLNRFKLRTKVDIGPRPWAVLALRGAGPYAVPDGVAVAPWPGLTGRDVLGPTPQPPEGWPAGTAEQHEAERIAAGLPRMGAELDEKTIPAETGLVELTVSFTKGCYTGQELVARIDSRGGHVPRHLRLMRADQEVPPGTLLHAADGAAVGSVTSCAQSGTEGWVALGYLKRGTPAPATLQAEVDGQQVDVQVRAP